MGSVQEVQACKKCGGVFESVHYYKTGDNYGGCNRCGYFEEEVAIMGKNAEPMYEANQGGGYGILCVGGEAMRLETGSPEEIDAALAAIEAEADKAGALLTVMVAGTLTCLHGDMPISYADLLAKYAVDGPDVGEALPVRATAISDADYPF